jgi:predicted nuclease of predicted toxin-antitoxin system
VRLVADESVEGPTVYALRDAGHAVLYIAETSPGIEDAEVLSIAHSEQALLLTADKDFGELVFRNREPHCGVLLIRSPQDDPDENAANTMAAIEQRGPELVNRFSVLTGRALRIRITPSYVSS